MKRIHHIVSFRLKYEKDSPDAQKFIEESKSVLGKIPNVASYEVGYEVSPKNSFDYMFYFIFENEDDYQSYNNHADHIKYVEQRWLNEVAEFAECDFYLV